MIDLSDVLELPPGVRLGGDGLRDDVLGQTHPVNDTARVFLEAASRGATMQQAVADICHTYEVDPLLANMDSVVTARRLNRHFLLNVRRTSWRSWLRSFLEMPSVIVNARSWPGTTRRSAAVSGLRGACAESASAVIFGIVPVLGLCALPFFVLALLVAPSHVLEVGIFVLAFVVSLVIHELGHALALMRRGEPFFIAADGLRVSVVHRPPVSSWISAAGPLTAATAGLTFIAIALALEAPLGLLAGIPFAAHLLWLLPITDDGRSVAQALKGERALIVRALVSVIVCYLVLVIGLSILGDVALASPGTNWDVGIGPIPLFSAHPIGRGSTFTVGWGLLIVAIVLGVLNAAAGAALAARRAGRRKENPA